MMSIHCGLIIRTINIIEIFQIFGMDKKILKLSNQGVIAVHNESVACTIRQSPSVNERLLVNTVFPIDS